MELIPKETIKAFRIRIENEMVKLVMTGVREIRDGQLEGRPQKKSEGKQYFVMHPRVKAATKNILQTTQD